MISLTSYSELSPHRIGLPPLKSWYTWCLFLIMLKPSVSVSFKSLSSSESQMESFMNRWIRDNWSYSSSYLILLKMIDGSERMYRASLLPSKYSFGARKSKWSSMTSSRKFYGIKLRRTLIWLSKMWFFSYTESWFSLCLMPSVSLVSISRPYALSSVFS